VDACYLVNALDLYMIRASALARDLMMWMLYFSCNHDSSFVVHRIVSGKVGL